jgi:transcriptional regulator with XRE-family HTH domain
MLRVMGRPRTRKAKGPETALQAIFIKRVREELDERQLTPRQFAQMVGAPKERTIYDVLNRGAVPGLTVVAQVAAALQIPAYQLMIERIARQEIPTNIRKLPERYPPIFAVQQKNRTHGKTRRRNTPR